MCGAIWSISVNISSICIHLLMTMTLMRMTTITNMLWCTIRGVLWLPMSHPPSIPGNLCIWVNVTVTVKVTPRKIGDKRWFYNICLQIRLFYGGLPQIRFLNWNIHCFYNYEVSKFQKLFLLKTLINWIILSSEDMEL